MRGRQALRLLGVSMMACVALGAFAASAQAGFTWIVNGEILKEGVNHGVTCNRSEIAPFVLKGTVGEVPVTVELEFGKVNCKENIVFNKSGVAYSKGKFEFLEGKVLKPTGCAIEGGAVTTNALTGQVKEYAALAPEEGITYSPETVGGSWATIKITGTCAAAGSRLVKGFTVARIVPGVYEEGKIPEWLFDSATEVATGSELKFAGNAAHLEGALKFFW